MEKMKSRYILIIVTLFIFCWLNLKYGYSNDARGQDRNILENIPLSAGEWEGVRYPLGEKIYKILATDQVLVNGYVRGKDIVTFSVVYYPELKVEFHPPEECNAARGDVVEDLGRKNIYVQTEGTNVRISVNQFIVDKGSNGRYLFYYFFKSSGYIGDSYIKLRMNMALSHLSDYRSSGAMLVFSTRIKDGIETSGNIIVDFMSDIFPSITTII